MHLSNVLTGHSFDYKAVVVAGQEAVAEATLGITVEWGTPRQRVLTGKKVHFYSKVEMKLAEATFTFFFLSQIHKLYCKQKGLTW